mgnify:FL=1
MGFYKATKDGYILGVGQCKGNGNITETEYNEISCIIRNMPTPPDGYQYRLTDGLEWELREIPVVSPDDEELTDSEALVILLGGAL